MGGGSVDNKTCRLYKALVMSEIAAAVNAGLTPTVDPFLFEIVAAVRDGRSLEEAEAALDAEIARVRSEDISQAELDKAIKQARALFAYSTEGVSGQSYWLAICENMGSYEWFETYIDRLSAVTVQDVRAAAEKYFDPRQRTVGWYIPTGDGEYAEGDDEGDEA
jgi:zinc protease